MTEEKTTGGVLFLSADNTGSGHKSIVQALSQQLGMLSPDLPITVVDGFTLGSPLVSWGANLYNPLVVHAPALWGVVYRATELLTRPINGISSAGLEKKLLRLLEERRPDVIVTVHGMFVGSILSVLEKHRIDIPFLTVIADLDNVSRLWGDKRASVIVCPSEESAEIMLRWGMPKEKLRVTGFPVRAEFCDGLEEEPAPHDGLNFLLVSGSQGSIHIYETTLALLASGDTSVTIIAGNNAALKAQLEEQLSAFVGNRVHILGFTKEMKKHMLAADILVARASPNVAMEAVNLHKPLIITGALRGQEAKNPAYLARHKLGVVCEDIKKLPVLVKKLMADDKKMLNAIRESQKEFTRTNAAREIAELIRAQLPK